MPESATVVMMVTAPTHDAAGRIVTAAVEERLAACGNIIPGLTSIYRWEGELQQDSEVLILFKTTHTAAARLMERVRELHPYDVPEILALPVAAGLEAYTAWVAANVNG